MVVWGETAEGCLTCHLLTCLPCLLVGFGHFSAWGIAKPINTP